MEEDYTEADLLKVLLKQLLYGHESVAAGL